jgi:uncharacterized membrane protein
LSRVRFDRLDALRGVAIVWMAVFHFCFDLNEQGWLHPQQVFWRDPFWIDQRNCIVSLFLLCAGAGQAVAVASGQTWPRFWRRWAQVAGCAVLVSIGSWLMFPRAWISFGVLHGMAVMLVLLRVLGTALPPARLARSAPALLAVAALAILAWRLPHEFVSPVFDSRWTNWTGLVTHLPVTEDYVPVMPWFGIMLAGYVAMSLLMERTRTRPVATGPIPSAAGGLAWLGRWSLSFYMIHQPVLIGLLMAVRWIVGPATGGQ